MIIISLFILKLWQKQLLAFNKSLVCISASQIVTAKAIITHVHPVKNFTPIIQFILMHNTSRHAKDWEIWNQNFTMNKYLFGIIWKLKFKVMEITECDMNES